MEQRFTALLEVMRDELEQVPAAMHQDAVSSQVILFILHQAVKEMGLVPVPSWKPPRSTRDRIDLVGVAPGSDPPQVEIAFCVSPLVELSGIKALEWVECPHKIVVTFSPRKDKVEQSRFFLTPGLEHLNLYD